MPRAQAAGYLGADRFRACQQACSSAPLSAAVDAPSFHEMFDRYSTFCKNDATGMPERERRQPERVLVASNSCFLEAPFDGSVHPADTQPLPVGAAAHAPKYWLLRFQGFEQRDVPAERIHCSWREKDRIGFESLPFAPHACDPLLANPFDVTDVQMVQFNFGKSSSQHQEYHRTVAEVFFVVTIEHRKEPIEFIERKRAAMVPHRTFPTADKPCRVFLEHTALDQKLAKSPKRCHVLRHRNFGQANAAAPTSALAVEQVLTVSLDTRWRKAESPINGGNVVHELPETPLVRADRLRTVSFERDDVPRHKLCNLLVGEGYGSEGIFRTRDEERASTWHRRLFVVRYDRVRHRVPLSSA